MRAKRASEFLLLLVSMNGRGGVEVCWGGGKLVWEACAGRARGVCGASGWEARGVCVGRGAFVGRGVCGECGGVRGACVGGKKCWYRSLRFIIRIPW